MPEIPSTRRITLPSWLISMLLHLGLILALGLSLRLTPQRGKAAERTAEVGIVLKHQHGEDHYFEDQNDVGGGDSAAVSAATAGSLEEALSGQPPVEPTDVLPSALAVIGPGALEPGGVGTAIGAERGPPGAGHALGGKARTAVFGIPAEGYKFVYVFDRSGSMGGSGRSALRAAKAELLASLKSLEKTHQFQIVFYNERPWRFNPTGQPNKLCFATEQNKAMAARFVGSITADGATRHEEALKAGIKLQPDVIFFLTDAGEPRMDARTLKNMRRTAAGITIHVIEFGDGPQSDANNFLVRLARQNGGTHAYVNTSRLSTQRRQ